MNDREAAVAPDWQAWMAKNLRNFLPPNFPKIVCLCGSTRFMNEFYDANMRETLAGNIVLSVGMSSHGDCHPTEKQKIALDQLHFRKIELADEVLVINPQVALCGQCCKPIPYDPKWGGHSCFECNRNWPNAPEGTYIGESTRNEIAHATKLGKVIRYLEDQQVK